ncbi:MAG: AmmeMemoRadiSam system protein B [Candidatus Omnitrophica bacterium]|nr:AmmeMemoRadiSam system protein B [Candidatus Omnitrophota bacterium]
MAFADGPIKRPNVSGQFYTDNAGQLSRQVDAFIDDAAVTPYTQSVPIIIAPHAGYFFSGAVAGHSFKAVRDQAVSTVVILAPSHFYGFSGISIWDKGGFETPLGVIKVDESLAQQLTAAHEAVTFDAKAYEQEHSLEVELPFIQRAFPDARIVPVIVGVPTPKVLLEFARALDRSIGAREDVLVVVSTDLSHYHPDDVARDMDARAIEAIKNLQAEQIYQECRQGTMEMCGCMPVTAALLLAKLRGLTTVELLKYNNSGDINQEKDRVVGYSSLVIYGKSEPEASDPGNLNSAQQARLLEIARKAIASYVRDGKKIKIAEDDPRLLEEEGAFVSVYKDGHLRGCIGNILGRGPLCMTVRNMAIASATEDHRFTSIQPQEIDTLNLEISVLSKPRRIFNVDDIEMGRHGVIISKGSRSGVFLPQVATSTGWSKERFLTELCTQKAGLPPDCWKDPSKVIMEIFTADVFSDK